MPNRPSWGRSNGKEQLSLYVFVAVLFITGVTFGAIIVNALTTEQREEIGRYLGSFFMTVKGPGDATAFWPFFIMQVKWIGLVWVLGLSVVGLPLVFALDFLKGVLVGFAVGYLAGQYAWKGLLFALTAVVPQNLVILPTLMIGSVLAMAFSLYLIRNRFLERKGGVAEPFVRYSLSMLGLVVMLAGVSLYEAVVSPHVMAWVTPMLTVSAS